MSTHDAFAQKFRQFLREIPDDYTLEQWQFAYRQVMLFMGMRILERFPNDAVGAMDPLVLRAKKSTGPHPDQGQGPHPPSYPCDFLAFPAFVLGVQTPNGEPPKE